MANDNENETPVNAQLIMDRSSPLGNSCGPDDRRRLHVKISNASDETEAVPIKPSPETKAQNDFILSLFQAILCEMKITNLHLSEISGICNDSIELD